MEMTESRSIKAIILAAGKGTRMKSSTPKVMHEIFDKTLVQRVIESVSEINEISEAFVIVGHQAEIVDAHIAKLNNEQIISLSALLQHPQLGTGDAVFKAYDKLKGFKGSVIILCGDTPLLTGKTLNAFVQAHKETNSILTVMSALVENPTNYGRIVRDENKNLNAIVEEKDATKEQKAIREINAGVYCIEWEKISPAFFDITTNNEQGEYYLTDIVQWAVEKGYKSSAYILENNEEIFGINSRAHLAEAIKMMNDKKINELMENGVTIIDPQSVWVSPETQIGKDSMIYPNCYITGENIIGENVSIGPFAHIRNGVNISDKVRVGNFVEIKKSNIKRNTNVAHLSYIGDSDLGENVNIGAGTITANYDPISKKKSKTILKNGVKTGSNSVLVAPVTLEENVNVAAGSVITKDVPANALAITRSSLKILNDWVTKKLRQNSDNKTGG